MFNGLGCFSVQAASETELAGSRLDARNYTDMPLESSNSDMDKLNDGSMDGAVVVSLDKNTDMSDGSYYVDIVCNGYIAKYQSLDLGCNVGLIEHQAMTMKLTRGRAVRSRHTI